MAFCFLLLAFGLILAAFPTRICAQENDLIAHFQCWDEGNLQKEVYIYRDDISEIGWNQIVGDHCEILITIDPNARIDEIREEIDPELCYCYWQEGDLWVIIPCFEEWPCNMACMRIMPDMTEVTWPCRLVPIGGEG